MSRQIVYGQTRAGGALVFAHLNNVNNFHLIVCLAGHETQEIGDVLFDDEVLTLDANGVVTAPAKWVGYATIKKHLGGIDQAADADLVAAAPTKWTSDHRLRGIAYLYVKLTMDENKFPNGVPNITAIVKGRKVYDPRTKAWGWSANAPLCLRDYLVDPVFGLNDRDFEDWGLARNAVDESRDFGDVAAAVDDSEDWGLVSDTADNIDNTAAITAADVADEDVALAGGGTEDRYTVNGVVDTAETPRETIAKLAAAMAGHVVYAGGRWVMTAGKYTAPTVSLAEKDLRGELSVEAKRPRRELVNAIRGVYIFPANDWQPTDFPNVLRPSREHEDGGERFWGDVDLPLTTSAATAQRLAKIVIERSHQHVRAVLPSKLPALELTAGDVVKVSNVRLGWSDKVFEVEDWRLALTKAERAPAIAIDLALRELALTVFDWTSSEETEVSPAPKPDLVADGLLTRIRRVGNIAETDVEQGWTEQQYFTAATLTDAPTITWDLRLAQVASVTLGGDRTLANPTSMVNGGTYMLTVNQDATGGRTLIFGSAYKWPGGVAPTLTTAANAADIFTFVSDGTSMFGVKQLDFK